MQEREGLVKEVDYKAVVTDNLRLAKDGSVFGVTVFVFGRNRYYDLTRAIFVHGSRFPKEVGSLVTTKFFDYNILFTSNSPLNDDMPPFIAWDEDDAIALRDTMNLGADEEEEREF